MITNIRIARASGQSLLIVAVTVLLAETCLVGAKDDLAKVTKEHLASKIPNFFYFDYPYDPQPGKRLWLRIDDKHWIERYPDGMESKYKIMGRSAVRGVNGTVVGKIEGDPEKTLTENEYKFQVFIPDKDSRDLAILFRRARQETSEWLDISWSDNKKTLIQKVE